LAERIELALVRFQADIHHPGLNFEKVTHRDYCTIRATVGLRIALRSSGPDTFDVIDIGGHDEIYRRNG